MGFDDEKREGTGTAEWAEVNENIIFFYVGKFSLCTNIIKKSRIQG